jgi:hypothetical protein
MKNYIYKIKYLLLSVLVLGTFNACEEDRDGFFDLINPPENPWQSAADFERAAIGAYYVLSGNAGFRQIFPARRFVLDAMSDIAVHNPDFAGSPETSSYYNRDGAEDQGAVNAVWLAGYNGVGNTNAALDFLREREFNPYPFDANKDQVLRIEGELRFVRAFSWWSLATVFLPPYTDEGARNTKLIPWRPNKPNNLSEASQSELASSEDIYTAIVDDLKLAIEKFEAFEETGAVPHPSYAHGRADVWAAKALLARVYFFMGQPNDALPLLNEVIDESGDRFDLSEEPLEDYNKDFGARPSNVIWYYLQYDGDGIGSWKAPGRFEAFTKGERGCSNGCGPASTGGNHRNSGGRDVAFSNAFLQTVGWMEDPGAGNFAETPEALEDLRYLQLAHRYEETTPGSSPALDLYEPRFTLNRPYVWNNKYYRATEGRKSNTPILKLTEMYLTRAIIRFNNGDIDGAKSDLNAVRAHAGLAPLDNITADDIHRERMIEMAWEGDRIPYLQALKMDIPAGDRSTGPIPYNSPSLRWPVPTRERELNGAYSD